MMKTPGLVLVFLLSSIISLAQVERKSAAVGPADTIAFNQAAGRIDRSNRKDLIKELDLSREQKIKLKEIRQANKTSKEAIENDSQLSDQGKKTRLKEMQKEQAKNIQAILTDEQKEKLRALKGKGRDDRN